QVLRASLTAGLVAVSATAEGLLLDHEALVDFVPDEHPPAPVVLAVEAVAPYAITVSWTTSASPDATGYRLTVLEAGQPAASSDHGGTGTTVTGLSVCTPYELEVSAFDAAT